MAGSGVGEGSLKVIYRLFWLLAKRSDDAQGLIEQVEAVNISGTTCRQRAAFPRAALPVTDTDTEGASFNMAASLAPGDGDHLPRTQFLDIGGVFVPVRFQP